MAVFFSRVDSAIGAIRFEGGQSSVELFRMNVENGAVSSDVLPVGRLRMLTDALLRLIKVTSLAERKTSDFLALLLSVVDADGGSDSALALSVAANGDIIVTLNAPANSVTLLNFQKGGAAVRPASAGGAPNLANYATAAALLATSSFGHDRVLFVAKNGNDSSGNGSYGKPFLSITKAMQAANAISGGYLAVHIAPGDYSENVTISRPRTSLIGAGQSPEDHATSIIGSLTVDSPTSTQNFNDVISVTGIYVNNGAKVTGTGSFMVVFESCYLTTGNAATNAVLVDNTNTQRPVIYLRNCSVTKQGTASTDVVKLSKGDVRMDTVRVYGAVPGTGNGILISSDASLTADRLQVDIDTQGAAIRVDNAFAGVALTLSNSGLKTNYKGTGAAPALYLSNTAGSAAFLWQVLLMASDTSVGKFAIDGLYNGNPITPPMIYGHITFGPATCTALATPVSAAKLKMSDLA